MLTAEDRTLESEINVALRLLNFWNYHHNVHGANCYPQSPRAFLKLKILFFQYFGCQNWDQRHKLNGKNTHMFFFYFLFKNNEFGKKRKNYKNLKVAGNNPNIWFTLVFQFFSWKIKIINFKNSDFCKLLRLPISPILKIQ